MTDRSARPPAVSRPATAPRRTVSAELIDTAAPSTRAEKLQGEIMAALHNALDSYAPMVLSRLSEGHLAVYNDGIREGRKAQRNVARAWLAVVAERLADAGVGMPAVTAAEVHERLVATGYVATRADVVDGARMGGLPLADTEE